MGGVVFLSCYLFGIDVQHCSLLVIEWGWFLALRWRSLGELSPFESTWSLGVSFRQMSWNWLSHFRGTGLIPGQSTKTLLSTRPSTWGVFCLLGSLRSFSSILLVFCSSCSTCRCISDVFVGRKFISMSYSSAVLKVSPADWFLTRCKSNLTIERESF